MTGVLERFCGVPDVPDVPGARTGPRTLLVCAHPDDETIGAGARLHALRDVTLLYVTDGAPVDPGDARALGFTTREAYAAARRAERTRALALAGVGADRVRELGVVDQEASHHLVWLAREVGRLIVAVAPEVVVTHPYEGGHPDHDATAFAVHAAIRHIAATMPTPPVIVEMTSYHARGGTMVVGEFLDGHGLATRGGPARTRQEVRTVELDRATRERKARMLASYVTQQRVLAAFPPRRERFRVAPAYDFTRPPHAGRLWYEWFGWGGLTGERWRSLAAAALDALQERQGAA
ncbi:MAG TPA: PIG-L family deacetylase [Gemmatimonadaceae bacterium]|nr:PIG-L family deacetylase [Gemmatimonadaceae bacterium]